MNSIIKNILLSNIDRLHTTELGKERIIRNIDIKEDPIIHCKKIITNGKCNIYKQGKNYYCEINNIRITINSNSYTIITAHFIK